VGRLRMNKLRAELPRFDDVTVTDDRGTRYGLRLEAMSDHRNQRGAAAAPSPVHIRVEPASAPGAAWFELRHPTGSATPDAARGYPFSPRLLPVPVFLRGLLALLDVADQFLIRPVRRRRWSLFRGRFGSRGGTLVALLAFGHQHYLLPSAYRRPPVL
jgi:hypothetical protein